MSENTTHTSGAPDSSSYRFKSTGEPRKAVKARLLCPALPAEPYRAWREMPCWGGSRWVAARRVAARGRAAPGPGDSRRRLLCGPGPQRRLSLPSGPAASCPGNVSSGSRGELRAALSPSFQCSEAMRFFIIFCSPLPKHTWIVLRSCIYGYHWECDYIATHPLQNKAPHTARKAKY